MFFGLPKIQSNTSSPFKSSGSDNREATSGISDLGEQGKEMNRSMLVTQPKARSMVRGIGPPFFFFFVFFFVCVTFCLCFSSFFCLEKNMDSTPSSQIFKPQHDSSAVNFFYKSVPNSSAIFWQSVSTGH